MIKINVHKIKHQHKNKHLFGTLIPRKQTKIKVTFSTILILKDEIDKNKF
jgi:hypothetical protein